MSRYAGRPTMPSYTPTHNGNGSSNSSINRPHTPTRTPSLNNLNVNGRDGPATPLPNLPPTLNSLPAADPLGTLKNSQNTVAAGFGEALAALVQAASTPPAPTQPIFVEWENRVMALGRKRMAGLGSGKVRLIDLASCRCSREARLTIL